MAQEDKGPQEALPDHLMGDAEQPSDMTEGVGRVIAEAVVEDDDLSCGRRELSDETLEAGGDLLAVDVLIEVWRSDRRGGRADLVRRRGGLCHFPPDVPRDNGPGVGREGRATCGVEVLTGLPQTDAARLEPLGIGQGTTPLATEDRVHQSIVLFYGWSATCRGRGRVGGWLPNQSSLSSLATLAVGLPA